MSRLINLEKKVIFGPVSSRRLGKSLGINLLPTSMKYCTFNCQYCFYGFSPNPNSIEVKKQLPSRNDIFEAINGVVNDLLAGKLTVDFITFAGNGEPTAHPLFPEIVEYLCEKLSNLEFPPRTAVFTSGSFFNSKNILDAIGMLDQALVKVDLVDEKTFQLINRPFIKTSLYEIVHSVAVLKNLRIQSAVIKIDDNLPSQELLDYYINLLNSIHPIEIQLYRLIYPTASQMFCEVTLDEIKKIQQIIQNEIKVPVIVYE